VVELVENGYRFTAQQLIPLSPTDLLCWLCRPELMRQWMPGVERVDIVDGDPLQQGCRTAVALGLYSSFGGGDWTLTGHIDEIGPTRLVRTYTQDKYHRTVVYDLTSNSVGTQLNCEVRTVITGLKARAARAGGKAEEKSLRKSLERLARLTTGRRRKFLTLSPQAL
jgi:hypothetical protein